MTIENSNNGHRTRAVEELDRVVIRFAGDSGDGMQLTGDQFTMASAMMGEEVSTLPDYPSEIRAPAGTVAGVSGFQLCFGTTGVYYPGDKYDVLVAMNPAAAKVNVPNLKDNGVLIINDDAFNQRNLGKAGYENNPLDTGEYAKFQVFRINMVKLAQNAVEGMDLSAKEVDRCKNFVALGLTYWLFQRSIEPTVKWIEKKFKTKSTFMQANLSALRAGYNFGESAELFPSQYVVRKSIENKPGTYRYITGNSAAALGLIAAARKAKLGLFLGSYPITPATEILHELSQNRKFATVFQAEDEIAGIGSAVGAAFGGALAATSTSGPGLSLKSEFLGLAVMLELPLIVINVQRGGPSTGLPTKTEQSDLFQAVWGRHGESPIVVLAAQSPRDCFDITVEAARIALKYMTPVLILSEGSLGQGAEAWRIPSLDELPEMVVNRASDSASFQPYLRNEKTLARPWAVPGMAGFEHRIGSLEKQDGTGATSHDPMNHEKMVKIRAEKVARVANECPPTEVYGKANSDLLVLGWGGTYGVIKQAVENLNKKGVAVAGAHLRFLNPLPKDLPQLLKKYKKVLIPENNLGQLWYIIRAEYLFDPIRMNKIQGRPFRAEEIEEKIMSILEVSK